MKPSDRIILYMYKDIKKMSNNKARGDGWKVFLFFLPFVAAVSTVYLLGKLIEAAFN